jgi:hypothetical protein
MNDKARYKHQVGMIKAARLNAKDCLGYALWCEIGGDVTFTQKDGA